MDTTDRHTDGAQTVGWTHVVRTRGIVSGLLLIVLGVWGGLIPFVGPEFGYSYTPDNSWDFTMGRLWLEILPGAATALGGLILLVSANRVVSLMGGMLATVAGAWFVVGPTLSTIWNDGTPAAGMPADQGITQAAVEQIGFFSGLGVVIVYLSASAVGRLSVLGVRDIRNRPVAGAGEHVGTTTAETG